MIRKSQAVALDCADPVRLAEFHAELLGGQVVADPGTNWRVYADPAGHLFCLCLR